MGSAETTEQPAGLEYGGTISALVEPDVQEDVVFFETHVDSWHALD